MFHVPNKHRKRGRDLLSSDDSYGNNGVFIIPHQNNPKQMYVVIASDGAGWEHVSVHVQRVDGSERIPTWDEMCYIKGLFWDDEDVVIQFHPHKSEYISAHAFTLHLWRPTDQSVPTPPMTMIGAKTRTDAARLMRANGMSSREVAYVLAKGMFED